MNWQQLISNKRFGLEQIHEMQKDDRSEFQRDFDRLIFSAPFRRLQNKTQVFPLPGSIFVHNRLTHSLEVSCVGRSLGDSIATKLLAKHPELASTHVSEIGAIVSAACLAHDLGNPPFGHSGEKAISTYFSEGKGIVLQSQLSSMEWEDLTHFEGNANAFRLLTHQFRGRRKGGFVMTYSTLASIVKYPFPSILAGKKPKFGFFTTETEDYIKIAEELGIKRLSLEGEPIRYARHPLVFLVEAADDICYLILDMEDAHKRGIVTTEKIDYFFTSFFKEDETWFFNRKDSIYETVTDNNERMAFLRATAINKLVDCVSTVFINNYESIMDGSFKNSLVHNLPDFENNALEKCREFSLKNIYKHPSVVKVELTGFNVIGDLLHEFVQAAILPEKTYNKKLLSLIPEQFKNEKDDMYSRIQVVLDYISNMTDLYAVQLYKDLKGM